MLLEPQAGARGEHEQLAQALADGALLEEGHQLAAAVALAVVRVDGDAGDLAGRLLALEHGQRVERRAADDHAVALDHRELRDLVLELLARAAHQDAFLLQRLDQLDDAAHVLDLGGADLFVGVVGDQRARAVAGEQLLQQGAVARVGDDVHALDAVAAGLAGGVHVTQQLGVDQLVAQVLVDVVGDHLAQQAVVLAVEDALLLAQADQLVGLQRGGHRYGHVLGEQVEDFARGRVAGRAEDDDVVVGEVLVDDLGVHRAHFAGQAEVDAVAHAVGLGGDEVAGHGVDLGAVHGRVGQAHAQQRLDLQTDGADRVHDAAQRLARGDAQAVVVGRGQPVLDQVLVDLRARAMHQHQLDAQRVQQRDVMHDVAEVLVVHGLAAEQQHEGLAAMPVDVGRGVAEPVHVLVAHGVVKRGLAAHGMDLLFRRVGRC